MEIYQKQSQPERAFDKAKYYLTSHGRNKNINKEYAGIYGEKVF